MEVKIEGAFIIFPNVLLFATDVPRHCFRQRAWAWAEPPHLVVANPITLEKMLSTGGLKTSDVNFVVGCVGGCVSGCVCVCGWGFWCLSFQLS